MTILYKDWLAQRGLPDTAENRTIWQQATSLRYAGGTVMSSNWGVPSHRDFPQVEAPAPDASPQIPHEGIEWEKKEYSAYPVRYLVGDLLAIAPESDGSGYHFFEQSEEYYHGEKVTPETIDEIIDKLQHFKRVVFGEGD